MIFANETKFDDKSIEYLNNFVKEFTQLFGKYVSKDELITLIQSNLDRIQFQETILGKQNGKNPIVGEYCEETKTVTMYSGLPEEELKSVFFHEMLHCINNNPERHIILGEGFDEGLTQYLTEIRDDEFRKDEQTTVKYPTLTYLVGEIAQALGEENFLKLAFDEPSKFLEEIEKYTDEPDRFIYGFDDIYVNEDKFRNGTENLFDDLLRVLDPIRKYNFEDEDFDLDDYMALRISQEDLVSIYISMVKDNVRVSNKFDFEEAWGLICLFADRLEIDTINKEEFAKMVELGAKAKLSEEEIESIITRSGVHIEDERPAIYDEIIAICTQKLGKESISTETQYIDQTSEKIEEHYNEKDKIKNQDNQEL